MIPLSMQPDRAVYARLGGDPTRLNHAARAVGQVADAGEARQTDLGHAAAAYVAAGQIFELQRGGIELPGGDEKVGAHEQLLRRLGVADEGDDLLEVGSVAEIGRAHV